MSHQPRFHLDLERHTLDNGLRIVLQRDPSLPVVAVNIWYHVGSKRERPGRTGFAHLFEHLLFQGSLNIAANDHFRFVQQAGGIANGSTSKDRTNYYVALPSHQLELGLWLESDRMGFFLPAINHEKLETQRDVVLNERRERNDQPYGHAYERLNELLYADGHPYRWPVIGYDEDIAAATLDEVTGFFETYYAPNNAVLTVAGDIDPEQTLRLIERYFGDIPPTAAPIPLFEAPEPRIDGEHRAELPDRVELPRIYMAYHGPAYGTEDWYTADFLTTALSSGKSSVMYEDLVYTRQLAKDVGCFILPNEETAAFIVIATAQQGVEASVLEKAIDEHLERAAESSLEDVHLERTRNRLLTSFYSQMQSTEQQADRLSRLTTYLDEPERLAHEPARYARLSGQDLRSFAGKYLSREHRAVVTVTPAERRSAELVA